MYISKIVLIAILCKNILAMFKFLKNEDTYIRRLKYFK